MKRFDLTILIGLALGLTAIITSALLENLKLGFLWHPTAALVVGGGTLGAVVVRRGLGGVKSSFLAIWRLRLKDDEEAHKVELARLAWLGRAVQQKGIRVLETYAEASNDRLISQGLLLAADHADQVEIRAALDRELDAEDERVLQDISTIEAAGGYAPTFGILGAVIGLISVLRVLDQPETLGLGIATAFVATIYGIGLANLFFFPLASRLRLRHEAYMKRREEIGAVILALAANKSPTYLAHRFNINMASKA